MCSYLHKAPNGVYYFRMVIPADLRPYVSGKREIKISLGLKDRDAAKLLIPDHTKAAHKLLEEARRDKAAAGKPNPTPSIPRSPAQLRRDREQWEWEQEQIDLLGQALSDQDSEIEELEPIMDAMTEGRSIDASPADILRAGQLLVQHEREMAEIERQQLVVRMLGRASTIQNQVVDCEGDRTGSSPVLNDIADKWSAEGSKRPKTIAMVRATVRWFNERMGALSVDQIAKSHIIDFKNKLLSEQHSVANINVRLTHISLLLGWAARNDIIPMNVAIGTSIPNPQSKKSRRKPFKLPELQAIFGSPVFVDGVRPAGGKGEAAYWIPTIAIYTGARVREIAQLRYGDVRQVEYADSEGRMLKSWFFNIAEDTDDDGVETAVKTEASERLVPVHPKLMELGLIEYVQALKAKKGRIFPLLPVDIYGNPAAKWGEWFSQYLRKDCGITDKRMTFHSFRHSFKDYARDARIEEGIQRQLMGHEGGDVADAYGSGYSQHVLVEAMATYRIPGLSIPAPKPAVTDTP